MEVVHLFKNLQYKKECIKNIGMNEQIYLNLTLIIGSWEIQDTNNLKNL